MKKILFLSLFLISCGRDPIEEVSVESNRSAADGLEGIWNANGTIDDGGFSWFVEYRFEEEEYWQSGYPPIDEHGSYEIDGDSLIFTPDEGLSSTQTFSLAEDGQTLDIGTLTFSYVKENP